MVPTGARDFPCACARLNAGRTQRQLGDCFDVVNFEAPGFGWRVQNAQDISVRYTRFGKIGPCVQAAMDKVDTACIKFQLVAVW